MNWIEINIHLKMSISIHIIIVNNLIRHNSDHYWDTALIIKNDNLPCWFMCKMYKCVYSCESGKKYILLCLMQSLLVDENTTCMQENNGIGSSPVNNVFGDWTDWYVSQPHIGKVTDHITSWWPVFLATQGRPWVIFRRNAKT